MNEHINTQKHIYAGKTTLFVLIWNAWLQCVQAGIATKSRLSSLFPILYRLLLSSSLLSNENKKKILLQKGAPQALLSILTNSH